MKRTPENTLLIGHVEEDTSLYRVPTSGAPPMDYYLIVRWHARDEGGLPHRRLGHRLDKGRNYTGILCNGNEIEKLWDLVKRSRRKWPVSEPSV